jgi:hypothetical protein
MGNVSLPREPENQQSIERNKEIFTSTSSFDSESSPTKSQGVMEVTPILAELTESAIDQIHQDSLEDALDSLLKAEYVIEVLLPTAKGPEGQPPGPGQIEESYVCTVYYNLACVCQKLGKLQE